MAEIVGAGLKPALEKDFRQQVIDLAKLCGWRVHFTWDSRHSPAGFPDLVLCRPPQLLFVELKTDTGKVTIAQYDWLMDLKHVVAPESAIVWRPAEWEKIVERLQPQSVVSAELDKPQYVGANPLIN